MNSNLKGRINMTSRAGGVSYGRNSITIKCVDLLEACPFSSRPSFLLNVVVEE